MLHSHAFANVTPIVLYNGENTWTAPMELAELLSDAPPALQPFQPNQRYLLVDKGAHCPEALENKTSLVAALFRLEHSRTVSDMQAGHSIPLVQRDRAARAQPSARPMQLGAAG
jgi:hypothetical protein